MNRIFNQNFNKMNVFIQLYYIRYLLEVFYLRKKRMIACLLPSIKKLKRKGKALKILMQSLIIYYSS